MFKVGVALVVTGLVLLATAALVGFPENATGSVFVVRGYGDGDGPSAIGPLSLSDGNLWFGAAIPTMLMGAGTLIAARRRGRK
jgi:hypothetical protein